MKHSFLYSLQVWLTTLFIAPLLTSAIKWGLFNIPLFRKYFFRDNWAMFWPGYWANVSSEWLNGRYFATAFVLFWITTWLLFQRTSRVKPVSYFYLALTAVALITFTIIAICGGRYFFSHYLLSLILWLFSYNLIAVISIAVYAFRASLSKQGLSAEDSAP